MYILQYINMIELLKPLQMKKNLLLLFTLIALFNLPLTAQRNCGSMDYLADQIKANPEIQRNMDQIERFTQDYINRSNERELNNGIITIPVIVHVVYQNSTENISDAQIQSQMQVLNDDFRRMNADASNTPSDFIGVAADTEIEFCLTQTIRVPTTVNSFGTNDAVKFASSGGSDVVNPSGAMNFWVCEIGGGILGYAQFPGGSSSTDGIVVDYRYFGTTGTATAPFDLGRTATHEVGHYLNLRHIWGDGGCNQDDFVSDTPLAGAPNYTGSPCTYPGPNSCRPKGRPGQADDFDMFQNYMDYSDDVCMNLFTLGQKDRMIAAINASRPGLISAACDGTPPPPQEICDNGVDDDGDGLVDCDDPDCDSDPNCGTPAEICDNGVDDDGDGLVDCDDPDCDSDPNCVTTGSCDAPTGLSHSRRKGGREATLSWNAVSGANNYDVEVYNSSGGLHASGTVTSTSANVSGLTKNAAYTWRVRANCSSGTSDWSDGSFNARLANLNTSNSEFQVYPNPSLENTIRLSWDLAETVLPGITEPKLATQATGTVVINMFDLSGRTVMQKQLTEEDNGLDLDISTLKAGMYLVQIRNQNGTTASVKFLKQ